MIRDQIIAKWRAMTPRERDAWIAEAIFGYETYGEFYEPNGIRILIPRYTEDIIAAWSVVKAADYGAKVRYSPVNTIANLHRNGWPQFSAVEETTEEAIGLAAILAKVWDGERITEKYS